MIRLVLPIPPSTNTLWKPVRRGRFSAMVKSVGYLAWETEAGHRLNLARQTPVKGAYDLMILIPLRDRADPDNRIKAVSDLLVSHRLIDDDRWAADVRVLRSDEPEPKTCIVTVTANARMGMAA